MKTKHHTLTILIASALVASAVSAVAVGPTAARAEGVIVPEPEPEPTKGNNGWGQEKRGLTDGTNPGSFQGAGSSPSQATTKSASILR